MNLIVGERLGICRNFKLYISNAITTTVSHITSMTCLNPPPFIYSTRYYIFPYILYTWLFYIQFTSLLYLYHMLKLIVLNYISQTYFDFKFTQLASYFRRLCTFVCQLLRLAVCVCVSKLSFITICVQLRATCIYSY